ncbi:MAG: hydrogenase maturation protease [Minicystis sp.]
MGVLVIGIGQRTAGDDGVGLAVLDAIRARGLPRGVELVAAAEGSALVPLIASAGRVVLVDAVLAAPPGRVLDLAPADLAAGEAASISTHGLGVGQAIELARITDPGGVAAEIQIVAVTIDRPPRGAIGLSPAVAAAVPRAAARVLSLAGG